MLALTKSGKPVAMITHGGDESVLPHAKELQRVFKVMTGAVLPIVLNQGAACAVSLKINPALLNRFARKTLSSMEAVAWKCDGKKELKIEGSCENALWLAVYAFLEEKLECRWFFPGADGEDIPKRSDLSVGRMNIFKTPSFITRMYHRRSKPAFWPEEFQRRKLGGGPVMHGVHSYSEIVPKEILEKHPEYAVMINGKREPEKGMQLCLSQNGVEDLAVKYCLDFFKKNPGEKIVGVSPNDSENFCDCPACVKTNLGRKPAKGEKSPFWVTRSVFEFTNRVAERVSKVYPDRLVLTIAYSRMKEPMPDLKIHDNVLVDYCSQPDSNWQGSGARARLEREITAWCKSAKHVGIFDYIINQAWPGLPRPLTDILTHSIKFFHKKGVRYYFSQHGCDFGNNIVNYYLMCALLWDVTGDPAKILNDFYCRCFRKAAPAVRQYFEIMESTIMKWAKTGPGPGKVSITGDRNAHEATCIIFDSEIMAGGRTALEKAKLLAAGDPVVHRRLGLVWKAFVHLELTVRAARLSCEFIEKYRVKSFTPWAWNVGNYDYHNTLEKMEIFGKPCVDEFREIMKAWDKYRESRYRLEKEMTLSPCFSRGGRSFDPKETLDNIWGLYTGKIREVPRLVTARSAMRAM